MDVLIYGAGAVGLGLASCLLKSKVDVDLIAREETSKALAAHGLMRTGLLGNYTASVQDIGSYSSLNFLSGKSYDYILVCVKSFDSLSAAGDLAQHKSLLKNE